MDKEFWEKIDRLQELAGNATQEPWDALQIYADEFENYVGPDSWVDDGKYVCACRYGKDAKFIHAANPAMIQDMIAALRILQKKVNGLKSEEPEK